MRNGDAGLTSLGRNKNIPKSDDRLGLTGSIEELSSHLGLLLTREARQETQAALERIRGGLAVVSAGAADPYSYQTRLKEEELTFLEREIGRMEALLLPQEEPPEAYKSPQAAEIFLARAVARRAERALSLVAVRYGADSTAKKYMNRLAEYLGVLAAYTEQSEEKTPMEEEKKGTENAPDTCPDRGAQDVVAEVLRRIGQTGGITLAQAKRLIEKVEGYADAKGLKAVIAVCNPQGNPVAVHVMDGAFLVSFDVAVKKAYTSASVKMSTMELAGLIGPGGTFQGLDRLQGDKMVFFGGGVPLAVNGQLIGALGVSGGTGEQDDGIAQYGLSVLKEVL